MHNGAFRRPTQLVRTFLGRGKRTVTGRICAPHYIGQTSRDICQLLERAVEQYDGISNLVAEPERGGVRHCCKEDEVYCEATGAVLETGTSTNECELVYRDLVRMSPA